MWCAPVVARTGSISQDLNVPWITRFETAREYLFRTVSQINLNYRDGPLSQGAAGEVHGGDRLPWVSIDGSDNFEFFSAMIWQIHVYGKPTTKLSTWCAQYDMPLRVFDWRSEYATAGFAQNAIYLLRPDTYVAFADTSNGPGSLDHFWANARIQLYTPFVGDFERGDHDFRSLNTDTRLPRPQIGSGVGSPDPQG